MAETLGSLCDKLSIVKLKQWHADDPAKAASLETQERHLKEEIDGFLNSALTGRIPQRNLTFAADKIYSRTGNELDATEGTIATRQSN